MTAVDRADDQRLQAGKVTRHHHRRRHPGTPDPADRDHRTPVTTATTEATSISSTAPKAVPVAHPGKNVAVVVYVDTKETTAESPKTLSVSSVGSEATMLSVVGPPRYDMLRTPPRTLLTLISLIQWKATRRVRP